MKQHTLASAVTISGKGLHSGAEVCLNILPAAINTGYIFFRTDIEGCPSVRAIATNVKDTSRGTTISENNTSVSTIEHLIAACYASGIDNAEFHINGPEVPILDGSSRFYIAEFQKIGITEQEADVQIMNLHENVSYSNENGTIITISPADNFSVEVVVDYGKAMPPQTAKLDNLADFATELANCRTFVFLSEIEFLLNLNLIKGGDLDNAIVLVDKILPQSEYDRIAKLCGKNTIPAQESGVLNTIKLQFDNEPARHKLLDLIGDLALCGYRYNAKITATKLGHFANTEASKLLREYFQTR